MNKRRALIDKVKSQGLGDVEGPLPVVSLEEFLEGNEDLGSIGCNLTEHPGIRFFFGHLQMIRSRPDVQDVLIEIMEIDEDSSWAPWPFSERVYILTEASSDGVMEWLKPLQPDEVEVGCFQGKPPAAPEIVEGMQVYGVWWD